MKLKGKAAIVTGGSRNLGRGIALRLAQEGADIVINYVSDSEAARDTVGIIESLGRNAICIKADVSKYREVEDMITNAIDKFGKVDILVNNAGISTTTAIWDVSEEEVDKTISINLKGIFNSCKAVINHMRDQKYGKIINISALAGVSGLPPASVHYCASKGGVISLTKSLAFQAASYNITVNAIAPGQIDTPSIRWRSPEQMKELINRIPLGRVGEIEEVAETVVFLASDGAGFITGATIHINGGVYMA